MSERLDLADLVERMSSRAPGSRVDSANGAGRSAVAVPGVHIKAALSWLKEDPGAKYDFLSSLHGADYFPGTPRFGIHYVLLNMERAERVRVKVTLDLPEDSDTLPAVDSVVDLFPTAEFHEREVYDMFGIEFTGHPDLRRILMPEEYVGHPQRRDFPLGGEPVLFTHNEVHTPRWYD